MGRWQISCHYATRWTSEAVGKYKNWDMGPLPGSGKERRIKRAVGGTKRDGGHSLSNKPEREGNVSGVLEDAAIPPF
jgi:hypothetical protein